MADAAAAALATLPELADGLGTVANDTTPGIIRVDRTAWRWTTAGEIANTAAQTALCSTDVTIPGPDVTNGRLLRVSAAGVATNNTAGPDNITIRLVIPSVGTVFEWSFAAVPQHANARAWMIAADLAIADLGGGNCILIGAGRCTLGGTSTSSTSHAQLVASPGVVIFTAGAPLSLRITGQLGTASPNLKILMAATSMVEAAC